MCEYDFDFVGAVIKHACFAHLVLYDIRLLVNTLVLVVVNLVNIRLVKRFFLIFSILAELQTANFEFVPVVMQDLEQDQVLYFKEKFRWCNYFSFP